jgi:GNAT superfamily N-acetyltransferase
LAAESLDIPMNTLARQDMTASQLAEAADANLVTHMSWVQRRVAGMHVREDGQLVIVDSGLPCDTFNFVCRARLAAEAVGPRVAEALAYFAGVRRPFSWWVGPADRPADLGDALRAAGLEAAESELGMAADLEAARLNDEWPPGLRIERARTGEQVREFAAVNAANWEPPDPDVLRFYEIAAPLLLAGDAPLWLYVGYLGERAVASAELTVGGGVVGLYGISTLAGYRRRGIGTALVVRPLLDARAAGYRTAVLQASAEGAGVYARVGFRPSGRYTEYKPAGQGGVGSPAPGV